MQVIEGQHQLVDRQIAIVSTVQTEWRKLMVDITAKASIGVLLATLGCRRPFVSYLFESLSYTTSLDQEPGWEKEKRMLGSTWHHDLEADVKETGYNRDIWTDLLRTGIPDRIMLAAYVPERRQRFWLIDWLIDIYLNAKCSVLELVRTNGTKAKWLKNSMFSKSLHLVIIILWQSFKCCRKCRQMSIGTTCWNWHSTGLSLCHYSWTSSERWFELFFKDIFFIFTPWNNNQCLS